MVHLLLEGLGTGQQSLPMWGNNAENFPPSRAFPHLLCPSFLFIFLHVLSFWRWLCFFQTQITFSCCKSTSPSEFFSAQLSQQTSPHLLLNVSDSVVQAVSCRLITRGLSNRIWCYPKLLICFKGYNFLHSLEGNQTHYIEETGRSFTDLVDL